MLKWLYEIIYDAIADFFEMMGNMGSEVFDLEWVQATVKLFTLFGWGLFVAGTAVCKEFLSEQLAEHIRVELDRHDSDAEYRPASILTKMKTFELTRAMLEVDADMEVDCDIGQEITAYIETWFDADKKFGIDTASEDGTWLNMYAKYDPFADTLRIECEISRDNGSSYFDYEPTSAESQLIKDMIAEKLMQTHGQTPQESCEDVGDITMGGMTE